MSQRIELNRRSFLRTAGMTAIAGAVGTNASIAAAALSPAAEPPDGKYDFDEIYDRTGTHCVKWDDQIKKYGKEKIEVAMGIADMDFRVAPCVTRALKARCDHENWGYGIPQDSYIEAIVAWNKNRHGVEVDPGYRAPHLGRPSRPHRRVEGVLTAGNQGFDDDPHLQWVLFRSP